MLRRSSFLALILAAILVLGACTSGGSESGSGSPDSGDLAGDGGSMPLKVMTLNIEYGGEGIDFDKVVEAVTTADPDILGVNEPGKNLPDLAEAAGYPHFDEERQLISRFPIRPPADQDLRYSYVEVQPGRYVAVSDVHLPSSPAGPNVIERKDYTLDQVMAIENKNRMPEATLVMENLAWNAEQGVPGFMVGDFNTPSHRDWTEEMVGARPQIDFVVEWPVTKMLEDNGFTDSYRAIYPDPTTHPGLTWPAARPKIKGEWNPGPDTLEDRIDMIFSVGTVTPTGSQVVGEAGVEGVDLSVDPWPTDHRGLLSTFDVTPAPFPDPRPFVRAEPALVTTGEPLAVTFFAPEDGSSVAIVPAGEDASAAVAEQPATDAVPAEGSKPAMALTFATAGWKPVAHDVVLVSGGGEELARSNIWVKNPGDKVQVGTTKKTYRKGEPITVTWYAAPANRFDWVGIYERGGDPQKDWYILWAYTNATVAGEYTFGRADSGPWPLDAGDYTVYYLLDDGYKQVAGGDFSVK